MDAQQSWQKLIIQALVYTPVETKPGHTRCGMLCIYEFLYRSLNLAGIGNRPPLGWYQIFTIWIKSRGHLAEIKKLCIESILSMQKPVTGFLPDHRLPAILSLMVLAVFLLPQTANTFKTVTSETSILRIKPRPMDDIDKLEINLPSTTDYSFAANQFLGTPVLFDRTNGVLRNDWIKSQQDEGYSLQLISTSTPEAIFEFCQLHDICDKSAYYPSKINGKTYYRLLYGSYPDQRTARLAVDHLPAKLKLLKPWARQFKQIKSEI